MVEPSPRAEAAPPVDRWAGCPPELEARSAALRRIRVCDLSGQLAGAGATRLLAAFGAQVIRVEDPATRGGWDIVRGAPPFHDERRGLEFGGGFNNHNTEKLGVTLNLRTERGRDLLTRLIAVSDVVTENFAGGVFARLGFPYERLQEIKPDIVYVSHSGFGATGPYRDFRTWGPIVQAVSGLTFTAGLAGQPPAGWGYSYMDHQGAYAMAIAMLAALWHRDRTGEGQWVDLAGVEVGLSLTGPDILDHHVNDRPAREPGSVDSNRGGAPAMAPHGIYPAQGEDRWVAVACRDDLDWRRLADEIGQPWALGDDLATLAARLAGQDALDARLSAWTAGFDNHGLAERLVAAGVPASPVRTPAERIDGPPATPGWDLWPTVVHPDIGPARVEGLPVHLSETDWSLRRGAPRLGQHNQFVLRDVLGVDETELDELTAEGVL
ncbi:CaiB/BaiF CoA transferase family protein [Pseudofrankia inefficax]|uniref:L-carnitine dehydratase/bile acid-inducible protein F n=1 Tax=Pseudofrankia inefficax (strain DSM 45817 / CECT 9037 / DDB 130130 / EuI1c) TaxID=298654 RepID=E3J720_PSEI1|nr:CoA transferase [Pseudofrankia inefficax]ADP84384.1 L-carnitine dehydratase/bile acid-inducible protein F [Pseudofrankia inefficax]